MQIDANAAPLHPRRLLGGCGGSEKMDALREQDIRDARRFSAPPRVSRDGK
jgi:hypothetical protein